MKKAISIWAFPGGWTLRQCFECAKAAGFDGVEVSLDAQGEIGLDSTYEDVMKVKKAADEVGIELFSVATGLYWDYSMTVDDKAIVEKAKSIVKKQLDVASWLGCDTILVVPGGVKADFVEGAPVVPYDLAYDRALEAIKELAPYAEEKGVSIGLENVWNKFLLSPLEMRDFIDKVGSDYVGSYFDVGNVLFSGYPEHWIKILGKRIKKVHFKDYRRAAGGLHGFVDLLAGDVDYPAVKKALDEIGYDGWVTAETIPPYNHYTDQIIYNTALSMDRIINEK
ncbi:MAG: sugar phosphate isomerase/epimerase [Clostridiales bacterium]|nr:sugar phosphate isomerase/epimerase [Clostridiales bacterium]MBQ4637873.1 sugar phosphate isomerase/epimerase [Clostridia bacterium]